MGDGHTNVTFCSWQRTCETRLLYLVAAVGRRLPHPFLFIFAVACLRLTRPTLLSSLINARLSFGVSWRNSAR